jgi:hypothetical protein
LRAIALQLDLDVRSHDGVSMKIIAAKRVSRTYTRKPIASPEAVLPLLCPVREADWIQGWNPHLVVSASGVAERDCAFAARLADAIKAAW